jgi:hypothetical protein
MRLANVSGTSREACSCGSWLTHWLHFSGQSVPPHCPEVNCINRAEVGALVQKEGASDGAWYVVPLCRECAGKTGETIQISDAIRLVPAATNETCG